MEGAMDQELRQARVDLAAALRLAERFGLSEGICNHFSAALPGRDDRFLLNPFGVHWAQIRARDILLVDQDGKLLDGEGEVELSAFCIHAPVHLRHPRARCIMHTHMPYATTLTAVEDGRLEAVSQNALRFTNDLAYDQDYNGLANDLAEGARMAEVLGDKRILFLANHGVIVIGESIARAFSDLYFLERACQVQVRAMATGQPLRVVSDNLAAATFGGKDGEVERYAQAHFDALKRLLDREDPDYAT